MLYCKMYWKLSLFRGLLMEENNQNQMNQTESQENLTQQLKECQEQKDNWKDQCLRTAADFENYKKRADKERALWATAAQSAVLSDLIAIVDDFDRAFASLGQKNESNAGFELIYKALQKLLEKYGVQEMKEVATFNPEKHEAINQVESADHKSGDIVQVLQKGYTFKNEVLRPAKVSVAK